jgi:hypothetical protein
MSLNHGTDQIQFASVETAVARKLDGFKPELTGHSLAANMNVLRLVAIEAVEVEAMRARNAVNCGHAGGLCKSLTAGIR